MLPLTKFQRPPDCRITPDLLAALELWQSTIEMYDVDDGICTIYVPSGTVDAMASAIAKARGE